MLLDDRDLEQLFRARASALLDPAPELFERTLDRIAAPRPRANPIAAWWRRLGLRGELGFAVGLVLIFSLFVFGQFARGPAGVPERIEAIKIDKMPTPPPVPPTTRVAQEPPPAIHPFNSTARSGGPMEEPMAAKVLPPAIARTATIALLVRDVPTALGAVDGIARRNGGLVTQLDDSVPAEAGEPRGATLTLLVDAGRLDHALASIAALGAQQARTTTAESIGDSIVDDRARLRNLQREETDLLHIMDRSGSVASILDVESKLADVRGEIERLNGELAEMNHRVATAQIDVTLTQTQVTAPPATPTLADHLGATWQAAQRSSLALATSLLDLIVWLTALAPFWAVAALVVAAIVWRSRSRF